MTVGQAADRLGVAPSTLRTWERRYGLAPGGRSVGGHRRYRPEDLALLQVMRNLVLRGERPARAAQIALAADPGTVSPGAEDDAPAAAPQVQPPEDERLAIPGASPAVQALALAAVGLDAERCVAVVRRCLAMDGVELTWNRLIRPVLAAAGAHWERTGRGVEVEHLLSEACVEALSAYRHDCPRSQGRPPVVLACAPGEQHSLPLHVLATTLAERGVPFRVLGPSVPGPALVAAAQRTGARAAFIWSQLPDPRGPAALADLRVCRPPLRVVLGGPGWDSVPLGPGVTHSLTLREAAHCLAPDPLAPRHRRTAPA